MWAEVKSPAGWRPIRIALSRDGAVIAGCQTLVRRVAGWGRSHTSPTGRW
jgi:hypothetical protein